EGRPQSIGSGYAITYMQGDRLSHTRFGRYYFHRHRAQWATVVFPGLENTYCFRLSVFPEICPN
ncbi:MAG TPA: hypothetical protein VE641_14405, partial [Chthoniobacterales bacterium]|nr:hypothetical protein [Chthoniobacterales bacterium]